jgi:dTDP-4-amino-4,6-dideoxygalactose transaminase
MIGFDCDEAVKLNQPALREAIPVIRSFMPPFDEYASEIKALWESRILTNAARYHQLLEQRLKKYLDIPDMRLFVNGHQALEIALSQLELSGEVITTPFTFISTTHAIVRNGLHPVFCDIKDDDYTIDLYKLESLITKETTAILPVHVYGSACDVEAIERIAKAHDLRVIYDAAHAFGIGVNGKGIGNYGDCTMFSFHATKVFHTIEGGGLAVNDPDFADRISKYRDFGITGQETVDYIGTNAKMDEFKAIMGICNLNHIDEEIQIRSKIAHQYDARLAGVSGIKLSPSQPGVTKNYAYYPIILDGYRKTRDEMFQSLKDRNIMTRKYFYPLCSDFACYKERYNNNSTPVARYISDKVLCLPMHSGLSETDVDYICDCIVG